MLFRTAHTGFAAQVRPRAYGDAIEKGQSADFTSQKRPATLRISSSWGAHLREKQSPKPEFATVEMRWRHEQSRLRLDVLFCRHDPRSV
jgi:hypothetical protein